MADIIPHPNATTAIVDAARPGFGTLFRMLLRIAFHEPEAAKALASKLWLDHLLTEQEDDFIFLQLEECHADQRRKRGEGA